MSFPPSLCIDLGASFTKVAYRSDPHATTHLLRQSELPDDHHFCIPSVAARNKATGAWVFGVEAMDLRSGPRVEVYQNWKADLFQPTEERDVGFDVLDGTTDEVRELLMDKHPPLRALDVVARYLQWLYTEQLPLMFGHTEFRKAQVQLCVPDFVLDDSLSMRLERLLKRIGFRNQGNYTLSEPKANLIGVLTEGQNALTQAGAPNLGAMFGDTNVLRTLAEPGQAVLIVDVGAFTTDLALAGFAHSGDGFEDDPSQSVRLGVRRLDDLILEGADSQARARIGGSAGEREHFHRIAYAHAPSAQVLNREMGLDPAGVDAVVDRFATSILKAIDDFLTHHGTHELFAAVLTGGGSNIPALANRLAAALATRNLGALHAPASTEAPPTLQRYVLGPELVRGASANRRMLHSVR